MADELKRHFDYGFTIIDNRVFESREFDKSIDKLLYMALIKYSYGKSKSFPSIATLAADCLCAESTLKLSLKRLEKRSYIKKEIRKDKKGNHLSNIYHLYAIPDTQGGRPKIDPGVGRESAEGRPKTDPGVGRESATKNISFEEDELKNIVEIIDYLNEKAGTKYKSSSRKTRSFIQQRLAEGFSVDDFKTVIDKKCKQWLNDSTMVQYLRPSTLFGAAHFEEYLNEVVKKGTSADKRVPDNPAYKRDAWDQYR